ncbi:MAG TPA: type II toxin-antitoxin system RelE/ParE family toxin [Verrucomicrobiae bacterium]|nr:type II toxin-antitoxin system RelE/ParE family toxin [Verrucomicrobiae bacterium]
MRYEFHPEALDEFEAAAKFYPNCQIGLELRFLAGVESAASEISNDSARWRILEDDVRRCLVHVFPYAVLYSIEADYVLILAVMHCSREPGYSRHRIHERANPGTGD